MDHFLKPLVPNIKSDIKDTTHLVKSIRDMPALPRETLLVTLDVTSLYTNIPNQEGIRASAKALSCERASSSKSSTSNIIQLMRLVLMLNNFVFNHDNYLQTGGIAMDT